jgi:hypothetical protein
MARTPKNPNVERVARIPFDKDSVSPMPQSARRARGAGAGPRSSAPDAQPPGREEYPGPQTASSGTRVDPGRVQPAKPREP